MSNLTIDIKRFSWTFITHIYSYECQDLIVGLKELFIFIYPLWVSKPHSGLKGKFVTPIHPCESHSRHQEAFMNFHYSYLPLWVSRPHNRIERTFHPYPPLWVSKPHSNFKKILFTHVHPYECQNLMIGFNEILSIIFIHFIRLMSVERY